MTDWTALGPQPAPGAPGEIRAIALRWSQRAALQRLAASQLTDQQSRAAAAWRDSPGADAFASAVAAPRRPIDATADILDESASALIRYAGQLERFQIQALDLLSAAVGAHQRLDADLRQVERSAQPLAGFNPFDPDVIGQVRQRIAAGRDVDAALNALTRTQQQAHRLAGDAHAAALLAAAALGQATDALAGWESGRSFGSIGAPPEGTMSASRAYDGYVDAFARSHPPTIPTVPAAAAAYWRSLDPAVQAAYRRLYPAAIGNAPGLPADVRDQANRRVLAAQLAEARNRTELAGRPLPGPDVDPSAPAGQQALRESLDAAGYSQPDALAVAGTLAVDYQLRRLAGTASGHPVVQLLMFDPADYSGHGRAALAIGDVATAKNVAVVVPGMTSDVPHYLPNLTGNALNLYESAGADGSTAVVAYLGYQAPGIDENVPYQAYSARGGVQIARDLAGFAATRTGGPARTTVIAHSYGSTTAAYAFQADGAQADALVLIGSPGAGSARTVTDLHLPAGAVFVGSASSDPVTTIVQQAQDPAQVGLVGPQAAGHYAGPEAAGAAAVLLAGTGLTAVAPLLGAGLGVDPAGKKFGAIRFHAETGNRDPYDSGNHSQYYAPGSESLANITAIVKGDVDQVTVAAPRPESGDHYEGVDPEAAHHPGG